MAEDQPRQVPLEVAGAWQQVDLAVAQPGEGSLHRRVGDALQRQGEEITDELQVVVADAVEYPAAVAFLLSGRMSHLGDAQGAFWQVLAHPQQLRQAGRLRLRGSAGLRRLPGQRCQDAQRQAGEKAHAATRAWQETSAVQASPCSWMYR